MKLSEKRFNYISSKPGGGTNQKREGVEKKYIVIECFDF